MRKVFFWAAMAAAGLGWPLETEAEILAMLNYESKSDQTIRREGIAIVDVDPQSANFGKIVADIPLPPDLVAHHIFYNRDLSKAYVTALGKSTLHVMDMTRYPYRLSAVSVPECAVLEDVVFSADNATWYLTCMGTSNVIVGDAKTDLPLKAIALPAPYPHGIALHEGIDRLIVTSTVRPSDLADAGEAVSVLAASTGEVLSTHKTTDKPSPARDAPVEVLFVPGLATPAAYVTNMYGGTLSLGLWDAAKATFGFRSVFDFATVGAAMPLEMYFNRERTRFYVTTAKPGHLHVFDVSEDPTRPKLLQSIPTAGGAHHMALSPDERYAFVQNSLLNLPGISDGSVTVIDLAKGEAVASMDTLKNQGLNPNCIVLLPEWHHDAGH